MQIAEIDGRFGRVLRIKAIEETDETAVGATKGASSNGNHGELENQMDKSEMETIV